MRKKLRIGLTYDVKEDYNMSSSSWKHCDFSTLAEVRYVKELLEERGHTVYLLGNYEKLYQILVQDKLPQIDIVMNTAEGINSRNREGWIPSLLEINRIPYSGSDAYALGLTLNKLHTKNIAEYLNIPTPPYCAVNSLQDAEQAIKQLAGPWILKPNYEGSSSGVILANSEDELVKNAEILFQNYQQTLLCESYIDGGEYNVSLLYDGDNTKIIGTVEIVRKDGNPLNIFDVKDKFTSTCTKIPACLSEDTLLHMQNDTVKLHQYIGCYDYNRADYRVDSTGQYYLLELNPLPSIDDESGFAKCCQFNNLKLGKALEEVLYNAMKRFNTPVQDQKNHSYRNGSF